MTVSRDGLVACIATALVACVEPIGPDEELAARFSPDECTVLYPGPGVDDGLVGICHADERCGYEYLRVTPEACRERHADHALDFRSDDPLCRILSWRVVSHEPVLDTIDRPW